MLAETVSPEGQIQDPKLAYDMAHAEKPYREEIAARNEARDKGDIDPALTAIASREAREGSLIHWAIEQSLTDHANRRTQVTADSAAEHVRKRSQGEYR